ncbi:MAG: hypothetical protein AB7S65_08225 [Sulfuricurvum sp.]
MSNIEEIQIDWEGPFSEDEITNDNIDSNKYRVNATDIGLYQIYASHPLYGDDALVYIGRTKDSFKARLKDRWIIEYGSDAENVKIYLGKIFSDNKALTTEQTHKIIEKAEVLLINTLKPAYNSSNIQSVKEDFLKERFLVQNRGNYRKLFPVLDSQYFWKELKNYSLVRKISELFDVKPEDKNGFFGCALYDSTVWIGTIYKIWEEEGFPSVIGFHKEDWISDSENKFFYDDDGYIYFELDLSNIDPETITLEDIKEKIEEIKTQNNIKAKSQS